MKDKLQKLIDQTGESMYAVAKDTGLSQTAIAAYLNGDYEPKLEALRKLAEHFDVPLKYFIE